MAIVMMQIDAGLMFLIAICSLILAQEDGSLTRLTRLPVLFVGGAALWHGYYLLGTWEPGPSGYPPSRLVLDGTLTLVGISRVIVVLIALRKNSGRLLAPYTFGMTKR